MHLSKRDESPPEHGSPIEQVLYPTAREAFNDGILLDETDIKHQSAKVLITSIRADKPNDDKFETKDAVLAEYIDHHIIKEK